MNTTNSTKSKSEEIKDIINQLTIIIDDCIKREDVLGLFPALYRKVTIAVCEAIAEEKFQDNPRMERLDIIFANRYLEAYTIFRAGGKPTESWEVAFEAGNKKNVLYLQHLLLGMNAHINFDLGIAAAKVAPDDQIQSLKADFDQINVILNGLVDKVQKDLAKVAPLMYVLDYVTGGKDEDFAKWAMSLTRNFAWDFAVDLAKHTENSTEWQKEIDKQDTIVAEAGKIMAYPGRWVSFIIRLLKLAEVKNVRKAIEVLM